MKARTLIRGVQTVMVTSYSDALPRYAEEHDTYPVWCAGCGESTVSTEGGQARLSLAIRAHMACCGSPRVWRGPRQRAWWQRFVAGRIVIVPTRRGDPRVGSSSGEYKRSFFRLLGRMEEHGYPATRIDTTVDDRVYPAYVLSLPPNTQAAA